MACTIILLRPYVNNNFNIKELPIQLINLNGINANTYRYNGKEN